MRRPRRRRGAARGPAGPRRLPTPRLLETSNSTSWGRLGGTPCRDDRHQLLACRPRRRGAGVRRALQRAGPADDRDLGVGRLDGWREGSAPRAAAPDPSLAARRATAFGPAIDPLFFSEPIEVLRAEGVWITDTAGRTYLDAYNNVPCLGHAHPRVTAAIARQSRRINTHTRYLHPSAIELAERLTATCPPELDTMILVNSGSEANDLAWRIATAVTGRRVGLCTAYAYHGITEATAALSPEGWFGAPGPDHIETWEPQLDGTAFAAACSVSASAGTRRRPRSSTV